jgi:predicted phosphodiesterase
VKLGIFSDVHGNLEALSAVVGLLRAKGATQFVCCGDVVGYGPDPNACVEAIRNMHCTCVAGNHDYGVVGRVPHDRFNSAAARAVLWTREQLSPSNHLYLENLSLIDEEDPLFLTHSSPSAPDAWEYVFTVREAEEEMSYYPGGICVVGHSHYPFVVERLVGERARVVRHDGFEVKPDGKYFINAGSVGQPRDGDSRACCLLLDTGNWQLTQHRVLYDIEGVQRKIREAGLPEFLASRLSVGR